MFETAELGHRIGKSTWKKAVPALRAELLETQLGLQEQSKFPVIVLISGQDGAGKGETINVLYEWFDPRFISTLAFSMPSDEERERPTMWRYWRALPPKGRIGVFAGSWYSDPIHECIEANLAPSTLDARIVEINRFEEMLVNEGALILKFWFHLTKAGQKRRLKALEKDPHTAWRVTQWNWDRLKTYDKLQEVAGHMLRLTNSPFAPWMIIEGEDDRYRSLTVGQTILSAIKERLQDQTPPSTPTVPTRHPNLDGRDVISALNLKHQLDKDEYFSSLARWQGKLSELVREKRFQKHALICVFEGSDAAGKGGSIRRVAAALDARQFQVIPIAAPTEEELAMPYLWRFWRHLPRKGRITVFDRSWYGRVLVERVEGFCSESDWQRAYSEINDFEHELAHSGCIVVKFWLQISKEEQLDRFKVREQTPFKRFKITDDDWRNREKWDEYHHAVCDMVAHTSTGDIPWTLVEANDKKYARVKILRTICERLEAALEVEGNEPGKGRGKRKNK